MALLSVAFPVPLHRTFTYRFPEGLGALPSPGARVVAPFGRRRAVGIVVGPAEPAPEGVVTRAVQAVLDRDPLLPPVLWELARWTADYYVTPIGLVLKSMLPPGLLALPRRNGGHPGAVPGLPGRTRTVVEPLVHELPQGARRAPARARALAALLAHGGPLDAAILREEARVGRDVLRALERTGHVRLVEVPATGPRPVAAAPRGEAAHTLTADQARALEAIRRHANGAGGVEGRGAGEVPAGGAGERGGLTPVLLHGVTGSGKTLVYLKLVEEALARGTGAIVLVPEIGLTPRAAARFREAFGDRVALLHSALSEGERAEAWRAMRMGEVSVAVGPRSAVFAPLAKTGVLVVDEEQETSYKQEEAPRYNAREVAIVRGRLEGALVVLGSATPSLESYANAKGGKYALVDLPRRIADRRLPDVEVVDMRRRGIEERTLSTPLREALGATLERGEQSLLLLNRRGFSAFLQCADCGATLPCPNCRITLTLHRPRGARAAPDLRCHYCDHREAVPGVCAVCAGADLRGQGQGTQQVEEHVRELFPAAAVARMDHDTMARKDAHRRLVERMEVGAIDILVGTQMVAKGHDFPGLTLVGVVSADTGLNVPDFRAAERTFQLLAQVAGRPGRGEGSGRVLVQTYVPEHPAIRAAARHDYAAFYRSEIRTRLEAGYPPAVKLATCLLTGAREERVAATAHGLAAGVGTLARTRGLGDRLSVVGPSPAPLERLRGRYRWHVLLKSTSPKLLESVLRRLATRWRPPRGVQLVLDRDPYNLM